MQHFFQIGGITEENQDVVTAAMLMLDMQRMASQDAGIYFFMLDSADDAASIEARVQLAIAETGAVIIGAL